MEPMETVYDLIIIGAGPAGLEAALQAQSRGMNYLLLEQDEAGSLIHNTMAEKKFLHVYGRNTATLKGILPFPDRLKGGELVAIWRESVKTLSFKPKTKVQSVTKENDTFKVQTETELYTSKKVILTSGTFEKHRTLGIPGELANPNLFYTLDYYQDYENKKVLVVGGGNSALETAIHLADYNTVTLIVRKNSFAANVAANNLESIDTLMKENKVAVFFETTPTEIHPTEALFKKGTESITFPYDLFFVHAGFVHPSEFLASMGIEV